MATQHNPFKKKPSAASTWQTILSWAFRLATYFVLICAGAIFIDIGYKGGKEIFRSSFPFLNVEFLTEAPETLHIFEYGDENYEIGSAEYMQFKADNDPAKITNEKSYVYSSGGIFPAIVGTVLLVTGSILIALFFGVTSAVYLSEYSRRGGFIQSIRLAIINLAGVPSIVFGVFGFAFFVNAGPVFAKEGIDASEVVLGLMPLFPLDEKSLFSIPLFLNDMYISFQGWNVSLLAGWFTLAIMVLPIVITASEESLRAVPQGFREGSLALGATQWQTIRTNVIPYALPGILTSSVLGITRVAGETAPIMFTAAYVVRDELPWEVSNIIDFVFQGVMALPYHIYVVAAKVPQNEYTASVQYATCFVFMIIVFMIALTSILLRMKVREKIKW